MPYMRKQFGDVAVQLGWQTPEHAIAVCPGSCPFMRADWIKLIIAAARWPARKLPANSQLLRPMTVRLQSSFNRLTQSHEHSQ